MTVVSSDSFELENQQIRAQKGKLVRIQLQPGRFVKMYEQDAIAQGLIPGKAKPAGGDKSRPAQGDKMRRPGEDKSPPAQGDKAAADDLTTITGIGPASARLLIARGITTFDELRAASAAGKLGFLGSAAQTAIGKWVNNG